MEELRKIRWLLKDKYLFNDLQISQLLSNVDMSKLSINKEILNDIVRIKKGEPLAYIIGYVDFINCKINVNKNVLIPRPETEFWVSSFIENWDHPKMGSSQIRILDLCCGSGCIGISVLKNISNVHVTFADISEDALKQTQLNLDQNKIAPDRYKIVKSDLFRNIKSDFNYILTNPPYVSEQENNPDLKYEPSLALYAKNSGLQIIENITHTSSKHLKKNGEIFIEFGKDQETQISEYLKKSNFTLHSFNKDQNGITRYLIALK